MDYQQRPAPTMHSAGDADGCTGGWKCSSCHNAIDKLPFKPDPARASRLLCLQCWRDRKGGM